MKQKDKMPMYGVGPTYVIIITILTIIGVTLSLLGYMDSGKVDKFKIPFFILGLLLIIFGITLWILAVVQANIQKAIKERKLITNGVYAWVRNPIYSAFLLALTGICFIFCNYYLLILPIIYYIFLTILMIYTEEKWLLNTFGDDYIEYCKKTPRCIPFPPRKNRKSN